MMVGHIVEKLSPLQEKILSLLQIPKEIYGSLVVPVSGNLLIIMQIIRIPLGQ